jgi:hypothetical protein
MRKKSMYQNIPNWFDWVSRYKSLAREIPEGATFVEVGSWAGHSTVQFALSLTALDKACRAVLRICSEPRRGMICRSPLRQRAGAHSAPPSTKTSALQAYLIWSRSSKATAPSRPSALGDGSVWRVFSYGYHFAEAVRRDSAAWHPKLAPGEIFVGHDIDAPSVSAASLKPYIIAVRCRVKQ